MPAVAADPAAVALRRIARLAAAVFGVPYAQVLRFDGGGDGVAAAPVAHGHLGGATPDLRLACASIPTDAALVVVEDATRDARLVIPADASFFAFARAETAAGQTMGALCLLDAMPHVFTGVETEYLTDLAALVAEALAPRPSPALADAEARFQALSEVVFDALLITEAGLILDVNDRAAALLGVGDPERLIGRPVTDLVPERLAEEVRARMNEGGRYDAVVVREDGAEVPVEVQARTFPHDGRLLRVAAFRAVGPGSPAP